MKIVDKIIKNLLGFVGGSIVILIIIGFLVEMYEGIIIAFSKYIAIYPSFILTTLIILAGLLGLLIWNFHTIRQKCDKYLMLMLFLDKKYGLYEKIYDPEKWSEGARGLRDALEEAEKRLIKMGGKYQLYEYDFSLPVAEADTD